MRKREKKRKGDYRNGHVQPAMSTCRDCQNKTLVPRYEYFRSSAPRCPACGGMLDYGGSLTPRTRRGR